MNTPTPEQIEAALAWVTDKWSPEHETLLRDLIYKHPEIDTISELAGRILATALIAARAAGAAIASGEAGALIAARQSTDTP